MVAYDKAGLFSLITFAWVSPFISIACRKVPKDEEALDAYAAERFTPAAYTSEALTEQFNLWYKPQSASTPQEKAALRRKRCGTGVKGFVRWLFSGVFRTQDSVLKSMILVHAPALTVQSLCTAASLAIRLVSPLALRAYLNWLVGQSGLDPGPIWQGCMFAVTMGASSFILSVFQQQPPWYGTLLGLLTRQQAISVIHSKLLRLNSASVSAISPGFIINLVSNDVRRFEDGFFFWYFAWEAPLELFAVFIMVAMELDWLSSLAGISATLLLLPMQAVLVRPVAQIRGDTAEATDARVRLASEAIQGALACKVLGWEDPLTEGLRGLRAKEAAHVAKMARIRASTYGLNFVITIIVSFVTFAVYRARNGTLNVSGVFFALALLQLPRRSMMTFMFAAQTLAELAVSIRRIQRFLAAPEPPASLFSRQHQHHTDQPNTNDTPTNKQTANEPNKTAQPSTNAIHPHDNNTNNTPPPTPVHTDAAVVAQVAAAQAKGPAASLQPGTVVMLGARYDWAHPFGLSGPAQYYGVGALDSSVHNPKNPKNPNKHGDKGDEGTKGREGQRATSAVAISVDATQDDTHGGADHAKDLPHEHEHHLTLDGVRFALRPGELLGVCGEVGAGKSSLLAALLGELQPLDDRTSDQLGPSVRRSEWESETLVVADNAKLGSAIAVGALAYCAQTPWIVAGSVRDNIVFGSEYEQDWYRRVVRACALEEDIKSLVAGDQTELGERGINLSGGQKARLALARAAYQRPNVALLDDPLSAVDPRVGRTLFRECIGPKGILKESTRILVTHQRQFLPLCDRVLVLRGGLPVALATWDELVSQQLPEIMATVTGGLSLEDADGEDEPSNPPKREDTEEPAHDDINGSAQVGSGNAPDTDAIVPQPGQVDMVGGQLELQLYKAPRDESVSGRSDSNDSLVDNPPTNRSNRRATAHLTRTATETPFTWARSFGPHVSRAFQAIPSASLRRVFSTRQNLQDGSTPARPDRSIASELASASRASRAEAATAAGKLVAAEGRALGDVDWHVYVNYFAYAGSATMVAWPVMMIAAQAAYVAGDWWLAMWSRSSPEVQAEDKWLDVYGALTGLVVVLGLARSFWFFAVSVNASTRVHNAMVSRVLRAPLEFFHTNPAGRVLNRFSKDQGIVDDQLPNLMFDSIQTGLLVLGTFVLVAIAVPLVLPIFLPLGIIFVVLRLRYLRASREVKRWEAVTRSPVYATFSSTLKGLATIRAYGVQPRFDRELLAQMTDNGAWGFVFPATGRWLGFRLDMVVATTMLASCLIAVAVKDKVSPALLGLALTNLLQMTALMQWFVRQSAEVENSMTSVERMLEYTDLPQEPPRVSEGGGEPPKAWPESGALQWEGVSSRYRLGLPLVLKDISFNLAPNTVCGVVGRTGSGKSSLALTLFRLIDVTAGRVLLDGVDVATIGIDALRRQLGIIPQDPVLFSGTVRSNLDPWSRYDDSALWEVLTSVQMRKAVSALGGLSARLAEAGDNLSVGQRQLFCLARALLQNAKVLVLDEATANVDRETDALIHQALDAHVRHSGHSGQLHGSSAAQEGLKGGLQPGANRGGRVLLVIAHRIDTILDSDHLLVLGGGRLLEQGAPRELASKEGSVFHGMVTAARLAHNNDSDKHNNA